MTFELFGIPGCGKSMCCRKVEENTEIKNPMKFYKENFIGKVIFHIFLLTFHMNKKLNKLYKKCIDELGTEKYINSMDSNTPAELYIKYMMFIYQLEKKSSKKIVVDEGIIHYAIALHAEYSIEFEKLEKIVQLLQGNNIKRFGILATVDECIGFIKKRNRKDCSLDFLEGEELRKMLEKYDEGFKYFSKKYDIKTIKDIVNYINDGEE